MLKSYPKIIPLVGKYADCILGYEVEVTEKVDGSCFAFGLDHDGKLHMRSKGAVIDVDAPPDLFRPAATHVLSIQDKLQKGIAYYGETLRAPRHNTLEYEKTPRNHIALFGMFDWERTGGNSWESVAHAAEYLDVDVVPLIGRFTFNNLNEVAELLERESFLGKAKIEGVVLKDYSRPSEFGGMIFPLTVLKLVSEQFKEKHASNPDWIGHKDKVTLLMDRYRTEARWEKAIQHLAEKGELVNEPKDIGILMKELHLDLVEEEKQDFMEQLYNLFQKDWKAIVTRGFPEFYKRKLLNA